MKVARENRRKEKAAPQEAQRQQQEKQWQERLKAEQEKLAQMAVNVLRYRNPYGFPYNMSSLIYDLFRRAASKEPLFGNDIRLVRTMHRFFLRGWQERKQGKYRLENLSTVERVVLRGIFPGLHLMLGSMRVRETLQANHQKFLGVLRGKLNSRTGTIAKKVEEEIVEQQKGGRRSKYIDQWLPKIKLRRGRWEITPGYDMPQIELWLREAIPVVETVLAKEFPEAGIRPRPVRWSMREQEPEPSADELSDTLALGSTEEPIDESHPQTGLEEEKKGVLTKLRGMGQVVALVLGAWERSKDAGVVPFPKFVQAMVGRPDIQEVIRIHHLTDAAVYRFFLGSEQIPSGWQPREGDPVQYPVWSKRMFPVMGSRLEMDLPMDDGAIVEKMMGPETNPPSFPLSSWMVAVELLRRAREAVGLEAAGLEEDVASLGLGPAATQELRRAGIRTISKVVDVNREMVSRVRSIGPVNLHRIDSALRARGFHPRWVVKDGTDYSGRPIEDLLGAHPVHARNLRREGTGNLRRANIHGASLFLQTPPPEIERIIPSKYEQLRIYRTLSEKGITARWVRSEEVAGQLRTERFTGEGFIQDPRYREQAPQLGIDMSKVGGVMVVRSAEPSEAVTPPSWIVHGYVHGEIPVQEALERRVRENPVEGVSFAFKSLPPEGLKPTLEKPALVFRQGEYTLHREIPRTIATVDLPNGVQNAVSAVAGFSPAAMAAVAFDPNLLPAIASLNIQVRTLKDSQGHWVLAFFV